MNSRPAVRARRRRHDALYHSNTPRVRLLGEALQTYGGAHAIRGTHSRLWLARAQPMEVSSADPGVLGAGGDERRGRRARSTRRLPREAAGRVGNCLAAAGEKLARHCRRSRTRSVRSARDFPSGGVLPAGRHRGTWRVPAPRPSSPRACPCPWNLCLTARAAQAARQKGPPGKSRARTAGRWRA